MDRELLHANRLAMLGRSVAMIVHDAHQPLAAVLTRAQSALRWLRHDRPDVAAAIVALERLVDEAQRASTLMSELRALASPTTRPQQALSLNALLIDTLRWLDDDIRRNGIEVLLDVADDDVCVMAERAALQQVFVNLIVNAIEAMTDKATAQRQLGLRLSVEGRNARVAVSDSGCGIAVDAAPQLFDAFYTTKNEGMGIGLAICRRIVTDHGGSIHAENRPQGGARLVVRLPRLAGHHAAV